MLRVGEFGPEIFVYRRWLEVTFHLLEIVARFMDVRLIFLDGSAFSKIIMRIGGWTSIEI